MSIRLPLLILGACSLAWVAGCSDGASGESGPAGQASDGEELRLPPARTLPIPGRPTEPAEPAGASSSGSPHDHGVFWKAPDAWTKEPPANAMRKAQYRVEGPGGPAECVVYYFGPGMGGDAESNARRWALQFEQPDGRPSTEAMRMWDLEGTKVEVRIVEVAGTYDGGMAMTGAPPEKRKDQRLLGGIAQGPDALWFFKFTGPRATVEAERESFLAMMRSFGGGV